MAQDNKAEPRNAPVKGAPAATRAGTPPRTSPGEFIRQVRSEMSKVVWPSREETVRTAIFVGIMVLILSMFFLGVDSLFGMSVRWLLSWL